MLRQTIRRKHRKGRGGKEKGRRHRRDPSKEEVVETWKNEREKKDKIAVGSAIY